MCHPQIFPQNEKVKGLLLRVEGPKKKKMMKGINFKLQDE